MKIVLIGFMGTGKSSVAPRLAKKLDLRAIEMDDLIVKKAGKSVEKIFEEEGEDVFRALEGQVCEDLAVEDEVVISTGGGVVTNPLNMEHLSQNSQVITLTADLATIAERIEHKGARPLFKEPAKAEELYVSRQPLYNQYANIVIPTDGRTVDEVCEAIKERLGK